MHTWNSHLRFVLFRLSRTHGNSSLADVERTLCEVFDAAEVRFLDAEGRPLPPDTQLRDALLRPFRTSVVVEYQPQRGGGREVPHRTTGGAAPVAPAASRFRPEVVAPEDRVDWFVREFVRLEQSHEFMWAGYIVKEMLPRIGVNATEARELLDQLQADGIVTVSKIPNPKNPDHPASGVQLNRGNTRVAAIVATLPPRPDGTDPTQPPRPRT
jgi:hypothetical protein